MTNDIVGMIKPMDMCKLIGILIISLIACHPKKSEIKAPILESGMHKISEDEENILDPQWYKGLAEVSVYSLTQNRYKENHSGEAVMIFVTEDFLKDKQVKNDNYTSKFSTPIIKNNQIRRFTTGLYDYSIFTSIFTEAKNLENPQTLKITNSSQDWCGQSFLQLNKIERDYRIRGFSYFENEADSDKKISKNLIVDEIFNMIRIDDKLLPTGDFEAIPSTIYCRLKSLKNPQRDILLNFLS